MPDDSMERLRVIRPAASRPSQADLKVAARRKGSNVTLEKLRTLSELHLRFKHSLPLRVMLEKSHHLN